MLNVRLSPLSLFRSTLNVRLFPLIALLLLCLTTTAADNTWRFSLGASHRQFDDIDFTGPTLSSPAGNFVNGNYTDGGNYTVLDSSQFQPGGWAFDAGAGTWTLNTSFDTSSYAENSAGSHDVLGVILELERDIWLRKQWRIGWMLDFGWFTSDADGELTSGTGITTNTLTGFMFSPAGPPPVPTTPLAVVNDGDRVEVLIFAGGG